MTSTEFVQFFASSPFFNGVSQCERGESVSCEGLVLDDWWTNLRTGMLARHVRACVVYLRGFSLPLQSARHS